MKKRQTMILVLAMIVVFVCVGLFMPVSIMAAPAPVEKTGQTTCYDASGAVVPCTGTGQDGEHKAGVAWPNPRFTDNGNGTVTDNLTGLIWLKQANYKDTSGGTGYTNWSSALAFCNALENGKCGLSDGSVVGDWRLANVKELQSLNHYGYIDPAVPNTAGTGQWTSGDPFTNVQNEFYWTSNRKPWSGSWKCPPVSISRRKTSSSSTCGRCAAPLLSLLRLPPCPSGG